jgi:hypothetical protein
MPKTHTIAIGNIAAGIVVTTSSGFRFFAADAAFRALDREVFHSIEQADLAVRDAFEKQRQS